METTCEGAGGAILSRRRDRPGGVALAPFHHPAGSRPFVTNGSLHSMSKKVTSQAGRKPKPVEQKRTKRKELCFTEREWAMVEEAAAAVGLEAGVYARQAVMQRVVSQS